MSTNNQLQSSPPAPANLFRRIRAMARSMRKGTGWHVYGECLRHVRCRLDSDMQCPLTFVAERKGCDPFAAGAAANELGLGMWSRVIMRAADCAVDRIGGSKSHRYHRRLRRILLRAAGLKPQVL